MARIKKTETGIRFDCPGCNEPHCIPISGSGWSWNGSMDAPTIQPSVSISTGHYASHWKPGDECWCGKDYGVTYACGRYHFTIADGRIAFCPDSTHALSGQTVDLPNIDSEPDGQ